MKYIKLNDTQKTRINLCQVVNYAEWNPERDSGIIIRVHNDRFYLKYDSEDDRDKDIERLDILNNL